MRREDEAKGGGKAKRKTNKSKKPSDSKSDGSRGDATENRTEDNPIEGPSYATAQYTTEDDPIEGPSYATAQNTRKLKKWTFLEHSGPYFPPEYQPLPDNVNLCYNGQKIKLSPAAEEVAMLFAQLLDEEYTKNKTFRNNFFGDWKKEMTLEEKSLIEDLSKCDFGELQEFHKDRVAARKAMTKEQKEDLKEANKNIEDKYGVCQLDQSQERTGNFKIEPPGLFRGRGNHPKQGKLKKRIQPEDVIINCSKNARVPAAPAGHKWKDVQHDDTVTWLASWTDNIQGAKKYVMLSASSKLMGKKDLEKYEVARKLKSHVDGIRNQCIRDLNSGERVTEESAVALYFIDKLALRAGNEKDEGETADTVGCCSLRVEHITLHEQLDGIEYVVEFNFLGKDSIPYHNKVPVIEEVFKKLELFMENKDSAEDLFDNLNTRRLNKYLSSLMDGLTAKVFRTYNASITFQQQLKQLTKKSSSEAKKLQSYKRANTKVAILCNHQRAPPKNFKQSVTQLKRRIVLQENLVARTKNKLKTAKRAEKAAKNKGNSGHQMQKLVESKKGAVKSFEKKLHKIKNELTVRKDNKTIALGTSRLNYLDPRITVAWCKNMNVAVEKVYNRSLREKFAWAIDTTEANFEF